MRLAVCIEMEISIKRKSTQPVVKNGMQTDEVIIYVLLVLIVIHRMTEPIAVHCCILASEDERTNCKKLLSTHLLVSDHPP